MLDKILGKQSTKEVEGSGGDSPITGTEVKKVIEATTTEILSSVGKALDERLKPIEEGLKGVAPVIEKFKETEAEKKALEEDEKLLEALNERRVARGQQPVAEKPLEEDMEEHENKKKAPGDHPKKVPPTRGAEEGDSAVITELKEQIAGLTKIIQKKNLSTEDPAVNVDPQGNSDSQLVLKSNGKAVPFEKSWEYAQEKAPAIKSAMQANGFNQSAIDEFDRAIADLRYDLKKEGITPPRRSAFNN